MEYQYVLDAYREETMPYKIVCGPEPIVIIGEPKEEPLGKVHDGEIPWGIVEGVHVHTGTLNEAQKATIEEALSRGIPVEGKTPEATALIEQLWPA